ncbi:hypothetical protein Vretimale_3118 [Volvox reticuliferus]|uniref:Isoprenylcysteine carboxylmethyltransferase family protein n=1 Tax=Volvox reticuliferus TaxID=1737510 RepID=A0A8J4C7I3_9CHLO|nr:hypothetical protein Vretifemale_6565 [Volvox reticuliferus]GIL97480.1 hypothetical protein Vretimale_3118 [Volvox reticuliferus]
MQSCLMYRSFRTSQLYRIVARRQPSLPRPIIVPASGTNPGASPAAKEPTKVEEQQQAQVDAPSVVDIESTLAPKAEIMPASSAADEELQPSTNGVNQQEEGGEAIAARSHPLEDVPEEDEEDLIASKELVAEVLDGNAFGKRGEQWLFAQVVAIGMLVFPPLTLKGLVDFVATLALTTGLVFIATAFVNLGRSISPLPEPRKKHQLVVSGIYGYVRHPMYGGLLLAGFGLAVLTRNETRLAILALLWWVLENKVAVEEKALAARYPEYEEYKTKVKKFFPFLY